jgi:hypothetical protein
MASTPPTTKARPPYRGIAKLLKEGQVIPFLGAGVNFGTRPPDAAAWDPETSTFLPSGKELLSYLANESSFPDDELEHSDLAKVASYFQETFARKLLRRRLEDIFVRQYTPSKIHRYLARIARQSHGEEDAEGTALLIITTNYDDLTERAFKDLGRPYDLVIYPTDQKESAASVIWWPHGEGPKPEAPNNLIIDLKRTNVIYKMHGSLDHLRCGGLGSYVITEDDYVEFLSRMSASAAVPNQFLRHFRTRHFLFLGYGLSDWNWRLILKNMRNQLPEPEPDEEGGTGPKPSPRQTAAEEEDEDLRSWAIQYRPSVLETMLWNARRVRIYDEDINDFVAGLEAAV